MEERAIRGVPWTLLSYASTKGLAVLTMLVLARLLDPVDFGLMALAQIAVSFLNWFGGLSFSNALVVRQDLDRRGQGTILSVLLITTLLTSAFAVAIAPLAAKLFDEPELTSVLIAFSSVVFIGGVASFFEALLQRELEFRKRFVALMAQAVVALVVSVGLAVAGAGVWSLVVGQLVSRLVFAVMLLAFAPYRLRPTWQRRVVRSVISTGQGFLWQGVLVFVRQNADTVAVGRSIGTTGLGFYSMGARLGDLTYWTIADPVARVTFPAFARSRARGEDIRPAFVSVLRLVGLAGCFAGLVLSGAAEPITRVMFGDEWLPMVGPLTILGLWAALRPVEATLSWLLNSVERASAVGWVSGAILVPLLPGFVLAAHIGTTTAVAVVVLADTLLSVAVFSVLVCHYVKLRPADLWHALRPVLLAGVPTWAALYFVGDGIGPERPLLGLALSLLAGTAVYVGVLRIVEPGLLSRVRAQVLRTLGRAPAPTPS
ncbi:MAG TPA: lipopolysaccharide biosynthesis protein [Conexibacter sp.]|nr:lipopolysaccharide biosynthesis protein [Conexibacter sp.]